MKKVLLKITALSFCTIVLLGNTVVAYTPVATTQTEVDDFVRIIDKKLSSFSVIKTNKFEGFIHARLVQLQNALIGDRSEPSLQKNAFYEGVRRKLMIDSFDTFDTIFDDGIGAIWTQASRGFGVLYNPVGSPTIGALASGTQNTLINGSYFSRKDGAMNHAGLLWSQGVLWSEMVYNDSQLTHVVCLDENNNITFWRNGVYFDGLMDACETAFQAGPMIYSLLDGQVTKNLATSSYIGRAHNRTVLVIFEKNGVQNLWFLTTIKPTTLGEVRDIVLRESRFANEYDTVSVFNLDGGSSVAYRNPSHPELNFGSSKRLPVVFEIYK